LVTATVPVVPELVPKSTPHAPGESANGVDDQKKRFVGVGKAATNFRRLPMGSRIHQALRCLHEKAGLGSEHTDSKHGHERPGVSSGAWLVAE
jgi:hypothetical protein